MFYKYINEDTIQKAPVYIESEGRSIYTNDETIYNAHGYYRLIEEEKPTDGEEYYSKYILKDNIIYKKWALSYIEKPSYWDLEGDPKEEYAIQLQADRELILDAWDIYSKNVAYGVYEETEEEHEFYIKWYKGICNKEAWAFVEIPTAIRKHMRG